MEKKTEQERVLSDLLEKAGVTEVGREYDFGNIKKYEEFAERIPIHNYDDLLPYVERMKQREPDLLWPEVIKNFAVSAGTTGQGKHLPLSTERISSDKAFLRKITFSYLRQRPNPFRLFGKHLSLPGSVERHGSIQVGEVSGFLALQFPVWLSPFQLVETEKLTQLNFREKFDLLLEKSLAADIKVITAVPGWILTLFQQVLEKTGKDNIAEVWPGLNLLICGGVKLSNFRPHLEKLMGPLKPDFIETYGASEGYFAYSDDLSREDLKLVTYNGIFYEFIKNPQPNNDDVDRQSPVPIWEVEKGVPYAVIVTTNAGLWRYMLRDIIEFTSTDPFRILVKGRLSEMLDDYGEAVYIFEAEQVLAEALKEAGFQKSTFTILSRLSDAKDLPFHYWLIQFGKSVEQDILEEISEKIDRKLQSMNRHYAIRREGNSLGAPKVGNISQERINQWLSASNKAEAQGKFPKIIRTNTELLFPH